jgi:hypothetical protein
VRHLARVLHTRLNVTPSADSELHESVDDKWTSKGSAESLVKSFDHFSPLWKDLLASVVFQRMLSYI